jgi:uncharacterized protein YxjI
MTTPVLSGVSPTTFAADSNDQFIFLLGSNLQTGDTLTFTDPQGNVHASDPTKFGNISSGSIAYQFNDGNDPGTWTVQVNSPDGTQQSGTVSFVVAVPPSLNSVSPTSYPVDNNDHTMQLLGSNFQSGDTLTLFDPQGNIVSFNAAKLTFISSTEIDYQFNDGNQSGIWNVLVNSPDGELESHFASFTVGTPVTSLSSVAPASYPSDNNIHLMVLHGSNFQSGDTLTFTDPQGNVHASDPLKLQVQTSFNINYLFNDGGDAGTWSVQVNNADGTQHTAASSFTVAVPPSLSSISPASLTVDNNDHALQLSGSNFQDGDTLTFTDPQGFTHVSDPAKLTFVSANEIDYQFNDASDAGVWSITVNSPDGALQSGVGFIAVGTPVPSLTSVAPTSYAADSNDHLMLLFGKNFQTGDTLTFTDPQGNVHAGDPTKLTVVSSGDIHYQFNDGSDLGTWTVQVNNPDGTQHSTAATFTVATPVPSLSSVSPSSYAAGNDDQLMLLFGSNFQSGDTLTLTDPQGNTHASDPTKFTTVTSGAIGYEFNDSNDPGTWTVQVNSPDGTQQSATASFTVEQAPTLSSASLNSYAADSNDHTMMLTGSNFLSGDTLTFFDPQHHLMASDPAKLTFVSASELDYQFNSSNEPGTWAVEVNSPGGVPSKSFSFVVGPSTVSGVSPGTYAADNNDHFMQISGSNFQSGDTLTFTDPQGNTHASDPAKLNLIAGTVFTYEFNDGSDPGTWAVQVNSPDGTQHSAAATFAVATPVPSLSTVSPGAYAADSNDHLMLLFGTNFESGDTLTFTDPQGNVHTSDPTKFENVLSGAMAYGFNDGNDPGNWTVQVNSPDGTQHSFATSFTVEQPPVLSSAGPTFYVADNNDHTMALTGTNFVNGDTLTFKDPQGNFHTSTASKLTFVSSSEMEYQFNDGNDPGQWTVFVNSPDGAVDSGPVSFNVGATPSLSSISPTSFAADTSDHLMQLSGSNFLSGDTLTFTDPQGNVHASNPAKLAVFLGGPIQYFFNSGGDAGTWTVEINGPDGTQHSAATSFVVAPPPSLASASPGFFPADNNDHTIKLLGSNFQSGDTLVFVDPQHNDVSSNAAKLTFVNSGEIDYQFNDGNKAGTWEVWVSSPDGAADSGVLSFVVTPPAIESMGATSLTQIGNNYFLYAVGTITGPELKFMGPAVVAGQFSGWSILGAEQTPTGYEVAWKNTSGQFTVWNTDSNGNYISNAIGVVAGTDPALQSLESMFQQDLNGDGSIGLPNAIESFGSTTLAKVGNNYFLYAFGTATELKFMGAPVVAGQFSGWSIIGAEQVGNAFDVAWKNSAGQFTVWSIDNNGNYVANLIGTVSGSDPTLLSFENIFQQDLNGDGTIAPPATIETSGATSLTQVGNNFFMPAIGTTSGPELKYNGAAVVAGQFGGGWTPIGAELTGAAVGYDVAWKNSSGQYTVWHTDLNGNYTGNVIGVVSGSDTTLQALETLFQQDLNGNSHIGPITTVIDTFGFTHLTQVGNDYFLYASGTSVGPELTFNGTPVVAGEFAGWTVIGAEQAGNDAGFDVAWENTSGQFTVWHTDAHGNYAGNIIGTVSGTDPALVSLESAFQQDLNGDGTIAPPAVIDAFGATNLTQVGNGYFLYGASTNFGPELKYNGAPVVPGEFAGWTVIGAEQTMYDGGYDVAWKNSAGQFTVWHTDPDGNYVSNAIGVVSGSDPGLKSFETTFHQDLNGDSSISLPTTIESFGATTLIQVGSNFFLCANGTTNGPELKYGGAAFIAGQFGSGWTPIGAEQTGTGYEVAWKNAAGQFTVWNTDSNGNYVSSATGVVSGSNATLESLETSFQQDLNGDNTIGPPAHGSGSVVMTTMIASPTPIVQITGSEPTVGLGSGSHTFVFGPDSGNETILGFRPGLDEVDVSHTLFSSTSDLFAHAADNAAGSAVITVSPNESLTIEDVGKAMLHQSDFHLV